MTVCIAVVCDAHETIIAATDRKFTLRNMTSADSIGLKSYVVGKTWIAMFSGDASEAETLLSRARKPLIKQNPDADMMAKVFTDAYVSEQVYRAESQVLGSYGLTMNEFVKNGKKFFGETKFLEMCAEIESVGEMETSFLIAGFDQSGTSHILAVNWKGEVSRHSRIGFWAIGTGGAACHNQLI